MSKANFLGEFEIIVLATLIRLDDEAYGAAIMKEIETRGERAVSVGALYSTLSRLEKKKYVVARMGEATPERGGRAKRYFRITQEGQRQLDKSVRILVRMLDGLSLWPKEVGTP